jgi:hypothetical protein
MAERNEHADPNGFPAAFRKLQREVAVLRRMIERADERAYSVAQYLAALEEAGARCGIRLTMATVQPSTRRRPAESTFLLKVAAQSGVKSLELERQETGEALVRIDSGKSFLLSRTLASLLTVLAQDNAKSDGELVGWKSLAEVAGYLQKHMGRTFTPHAVRQLVSRLRSAIAISGGLNPFLVQSNPRLGLRFALQRPTRVASQ